MLLLRHRAVGDRRASGADHRHGRGRRRRGRITRRRPGALAPEHHRRCGGQRLRGRGLSRLRPAHRCDHGPDLHRGRQRPPRRRGQAHHLLLRGRRARDCGVPRSAVGGRRRRGRQCVHRGHLQQSGPARRRGHRRHLDRGREWHGGGLWRRRPCHGSVRLDADGAGDRHRGQSPHRGVRRPAESRCDDRAHLDHRRGRLGRVSGRRPRERGGLRRRHGRHRRPRRQHPRRGLRQWSRLPAGCRHASHQRHPGQHRLRDGRRGGRQRGERLLRRDARLSLRRRQRRHDDRGRRRRVPMRAIPGRRRPRYRCLPRREHRPRGRSGRKRAGRIIVPGRARRPLDGAPVDGRRERNALPLRRRWPGPQRLPRPLHDVRRHGRSRR